VSGCPVANRRERKAAESGELRAESELNKPNERERHKPAHTVGEKGRPGTHEVGVALLEEGATGYPLAGVPITGAAGAQ
jgi:hypothetical protein